MKTIIYNGLTKTNIEVNIIVKEETLSFGTYKSAWYEVNGERLFRIETKGRTVRKAVYPTFDQYMELIKTMYSDFSSDVFAIPKDESFHSSINQIAQSFGGVELYPTIEEKGANLLYYITKNHSFVDGNKRIAAACFLFFMEKNNALYSADKGPVISNEALAALTLFIATSKTEEVNVVKDLIVCILNN
jgi:prophage maintenance system killer protein